MTRDRVTARIGDREVSVVRHGRDRIELEGETFATRETWPGTWHVSGRGRTTLVHVARDTDGTCWVHADGRVHRIELAPAGRPRRPSPAAHDEPLTAPMPATVRAILAELGQSVRAGDTILMLEAMKMELPIRAPRDAVVAALHCREGQLVQPGVTLVELA